MMHKRYIKNTETITVYYDGSCPLCKREIGFYKKRLGKETQFQDVSNRQDNPAEDLSRQQAMQRFHVRSKTGELKSGAGAFALILKEVSGFGWLGKFLSFKSVSVLADIFYDIFLKIRPVLQALFRLWDNRKNNQ